MQQNNNNNNNNNKNLIHLHYKKAKERIFYYLGMDKFCSAYLSCEVCARNFISLTKLWYLTADIWKRCQISLS